MAIINQEALEERARALYTIPTTMAPEAFGSLSPSCQTLMGTHYERHGDRYVLNHSVYEILPADRFAILQCLVRHNGIRMVLVSIEADRARLEVHFYNRNFIDAFLAATVADSAAARRLFPISGGRRLQAGEATGQVQVISVDEPDPADPEVSVLVLTVSPVGDYSTYTLSINSQDYRDISIDPLFSEIDFKFRPGCFNIDCAPEWTPAPAPEDNPAIDYLAKDYDSFKHTLITAMTERVPGWQPTSEADLDQVLLELFCAAADELSDHQDRVMNEAYLSTVRKRVSLARHARLMDYHIHQGNQAITWLAVMLHEDETLEVPSPRADPEAQPIPLTVWAGNEDMNAPAAVVFVSRTEQHMDHRLNRLTLYTWSGSVPSLGAGSTTADLQPLNTDGAPLTDHESNLAVQELIVSGQVRHLLIQERLNPATGRPAGRDSGKRQLLRLMPGMEGAEARCDPVPGIAGEWFVRVRWEERDALKANYCFTIDCPDGQQENVSLFHANLVPVCHGRPARVIFRSPEAPLTAENEFHYEPTLRWGSLCRLPAAPLAYRDTPVGGTAPTRSTLEVEVVTAGVSEPWDEVTSLVHSDDSTKGGNHFVVETDENERSVLRFGNGNNGRQLPDGADVRCTYQVGRGLEGNIGADMLNRIDALLFPEIDACWNPFDVTSGRSPESAIKIIRRVPEAYRTHQLRAVTLQDYVDRAQELKEVSRAAARYAWTGSGRTVQLAIDPVGMHILTPELRHRIGRHLEAVRLIGEDLEIRPPRFVPLEILVSLCIDPDYWIEDVRFLIEQEFSEGYTPDGRQAFFHPDRWTFGQKLRASEIIGRIQRLEGVDHVVTVTMKRWNEATPGTHAIAELAANEIVRVLNDPDHMADGFMTLAIGGGRQ